jgi:actin-related protein
LKFKKLFGKVLLKIFYRYIFLLLKKIEKVGGYSNTSLFITEQPYTPKKIKELNEEIFFEQFSFSELSVTSTAYSNFLGFVTENQNSKFSKLGSAMILDSGFSFTHCLPIWKNKVYFDKGTFNY